MTVLKEEDARILADNARRTQKVYFCHMDVKYGEDDWTEGETVKTFSREIAMKNFKEVQELREKGVLVKNLKMCSTTVFIEEEEEKNA